MHKCIVTVKKLNKRSGVPASFSDKSNITGIVLKGFSFEAKEAAIVNPNIGKWYVDRDNNFYWGGGLNVLEESEFADSLEEGVENDQLEQFNITPVLKVKIEKVINAFESGSANGNYALLVKYKDHTNPTTKTREIQVTYGRSQTTEFGHLKTLIQDYIAHDGKYSEALKPYLQKIGKYPSLATNDTFCSILIKAGKEDPIMKSCQDNLFETKYYSPAHNWFSTNGFELPLSMLVIYDSYIHSGGILAFLRKRFKQVVPASGGDEKQWVAAYLETRHNWLTHHSEALLRKTNYRTKCLMLQIQNGNWNLEQSINANGVIIK